MSFWNRPLHAMTDAFTAAGFRIIGHQRAAARAGSTRAVPRRIPRPVDRHELPVLRPARRLIDDDRLVRDDRGSCKGPPPDCRRIVDTPPVRHQAPIVTAGQRAKAPGQARVSRSERLNFIGPLALLLKERQRNANQLDPLKFRSSHRFFKPFEELPNLSLVVLCRVRIRQLLY